MTEDRRWPKGFTPDDGQPNYINEAMAEDYYAEVVRGAALAWTATQDNENVREWSDGFADWCADRFRGSDYPRTYRLPAFARSWATFWGEPLVYPGEEPEDES